MKQYKLQTLIITKLEKLLQVNYHNITLILGELLTITNPIMSQQTNNQMTDYSHPKYKDLYKEILIDYNFRYGKFSPIPYPMNPQIKEEK